MSQQSIQPLMKHLVRSSLWVMLLFFLSRVTGMVKVIKMSSLFGITYQADAFTAANQLPELFTMMISGGALGAALIPIYSKYLLNQDKKKQEQLANTTVTIVFISMLIVAILVGLFAPFITNSFLLRASSAEVQKLTIELIRILMISMMIIGVSGVVSALLNAHQHFIAPALATVTIDIGHIIGLFFLVPQFGIKGAAYGSVIGAVFHIGIQLPMLFRYNLRFKPQIVYQLKGTWEMLRLLFPRMITLGTQQLIDLWLIFLSSRYPDGAISAYYYAQLGLYIPVALFSQSIVTTIFPTMVARYSQNGIKGLHQISSKVIHIICFLIAPTCLGLLVFGRAGTKLLFERGEFDASSTTMVATILSIFIVRMIGLSFIEFYEKLFFARQDTKTPMWGYIIWLFIHAILAYGLMKTVGFYGIAWASSISTILLAIGLGLKNQQRMHSWLSTPEKQGIKRVGYTIITTAIIIYLLPIPSDLEWGGLFIWTIGCFGIYLIGYILWGGLDDLRKWKKFIQ